MSTGGRRKKKFAVDSQASDKMSSLIQDFNAFSKEFSKTKIDTKKRRKKPKPKVIPKFVKQESNLSEDSNDPKRRKNVIGSMDTNPMLQHLSAQGKLPIFNQSINEEPFHSDDDLSKEESKNEEEVKLQDKDPQLDFHNKKSNTNFFFVHKKTKNSRQSILADRPLTIFKNNTKRDSMFRFFSPPPPTKSKFEKVSQKRIPNINSGELPKQGIEVTPVQKPRKRKIYRQNSGFKKVVLKANKNNSKNRAFQLRGKLNMRFS